MGHVRQRQVVIIRRSVPITLPPKLTPHNTVVIAGDDGHSAANNISTLRAHMERNPVGRFSNAMVHWEVAVKAAKKKITLSLDAAIWLQRAERAPGIRLLPIDRDVLLLSTRLLGIAHNDPADRMLIASAQINNIPLVTADRLIIEYARADPGTPVVDVRP